MKTPIGDQECKMVAVHTGEGWQLEVQTQEGEHVTMLAWPASWPGTMTWEDLERFGFEIQ